MSERFYPVVVGRYLGDYSNKPSSLCWSIADHERANATIGEKFNTRDDAQTRANDLNANYLTNVCHVCKAPMLGNHYHE